MDSDQKFWIYIWSLAAATVAPFLIMLVLRDTYTDAIRLRALQEMVRNGANPMSAACAIEGRNSSDNQYPIACQGSR